ncbi:hypothetical protein Gohar_018164, partial [Gossypium harknessii]|nr:hypothetical protein [Gossypium harknessii]
MPTFTAIALDRLIEPGPSRSVNNSGPNSKPPIPNPKPIPSTKMKRSSSTSVTSKVNRPQISPALYATPEATPLPDSPSSFPPSPYIINHKRRGPRLLKSFSEDNVSSWEKKAHEEDEVNGNAKLAEGNSVDLLKDCSVTFSIHEPNEEEHENGAHNGPINVEQANSVHGGSIKEEHMNCFHDGEVGSSQMNNGLAIDASVLKPGALNLEKGGDSEDFFDPNESMSVASNTEGGDDAAAESAARFATQGVEFFDAWDDFLFPPELSSESLPQSGPHDIEAELREIRLSLLTEIEKRKQAEEALNKMQSKWRRIGQEFGDVGLSLPVDPLVVTEDELVNPAEELRQQMGIARFVSLSMGRGIAKAELETEMEAQIESKNFEIARLLDRLHYYEAVNREMSQRNQEAVEMARRERQRKKRKQRWVWGSVATAITLGAAALAWSYFPTGKASSSASIAKGPDPDNPTA